MFYRRGNDVFALSVASGAIRQLTDVRAGPKPPDEKDAEGQRAFLEAQQLELFEHVRLDRTRQDSAKARREARESAGLRPAYLERGEEVGGAFANASGSHVLVATTTSPSTRRTAVVPDWVTISGYTEEIQSRTKVGDTLSVGRVGLLRTHSGEITWLKPAPAEVDSGDVSSAIVGWNDAGTYGLLTATADDDQHWWLYSVSAATGELILLDHVFDEAWVGGPCAAACRGWIPGTDRAFYVTETTGFAHLYTVNADGSDKRPLTSGEWEVLSVEIPQTRDHFLLTTNEGSPFDQHVSRMAFDGSAKRALTRGPGFYQATPSPDGQSLAIVHSRANQPPEVYLAPASDPGRMDRITTSPTPEWSSFAWIQPEIVHVPAEDGTRVPARIYRPADLGAEPNGAAVIFVHGSGYLHNVHNYWSTYSREYMFHHFLAASGYTVLDVDYRGSAGYGRDWRTAIYRWMGGKDLSDQVDGARYLVEREGVDASRIGIYGGSYGGFITLMALFTAGDSFKSGAALRPVTDWAHYNEPYTSNILNDPRDDTLAYRQSSPIYFADNLRPDQHLLILHGMVDTNVHFSDVVRLTQRLIELGKENWDLAVYPVEDHGFVEPTSWTDEYRRVFELFDRTLSRSACVPGAECASAQGAPAGGS